MAFTHAAVGLALASVTVFLAPTYATVAAVAAIGGGVAPDLDLFVGQHRKTLHFPVYYWVPALLTLSAAVLVPDPTVVAAAAFFLAAAVHSGTDALGAGDELRPWEATSERGVYCHLRNRWVAPRRWVRYDGAPEDLLLAAVFALPGVVLYDGPIRTVTVLGLVAATVYALVRKRIPEHVPERWL